jgi:penicillin G amidase
MFGPYKWLLRGLAALVLLVGLTAGGTWLFARSSLPKVSGSTTVAGLGAPLEIVRDRSGVPHIFAQSRNDAYFGLGYAHAQDRLWQMELSRRTAAGRISELVGPPALEVDKLLRTLGLYRLAEIRAQRASPEARAVLAAYAAGVNAYLAGHNGALPPEFLVLRASPEPWQPADSLAWLGVMALDLAANWRSELLRLRLADRLDEAQLAQFFAPYPGTSGAVPANQAALYRELGRDFALERMIALLPGGETMAGSNNWVLAGGRTATGKPLLANDPHLRLGTPSLWYLAHVSWPGQDIVGGTLPGVPSIILGRNRRIAWGFTNTGPDVQDLYIEKLDPKDASRYVTPDGTAPFATRREVIRVRGGGDYELTVRSTRHGPVISDVMRRAGDAIPTGHVLALAWTALAEDDQTAEAGVIMSEAQDWPTFRRGLSHLHSPSQNVVYADVDGNIGFQMNGRVPIRRSDNPVKGIAPVPGWEARFDWDGTIPFEQLPSSFNPAGGALATANHKIVGDDYPFHLTFEWAEPYRIRRIHEMLAAQQRHSLDSFRRMQADIVSPMAREFLPVLLAAAPDSARGRAARKLLERWDGSMARDRPEPLLFAAWYRETTRGLYSDELGDRFEEAWGQRPLFVLPALTGAGDWCKDKTAGRPKTCSDVIAEALDRAWDELEKRHGSDPSRWRWGAAHAAALKHQPFTRIAGLRELFDLSAPTGGDAYTVNAGNMDIRDPETPFANIHAAGFRAIYDLDDLDRSLFMQSTGQSGNVLSSLYGNLVQPWAEVDYLPMSIRRRDAEAGAIGTLKLTPR